MLISKINDAIAHLVAPISSSSARSKVEYRKEGEFKRERNPKKPAESDQQPASGTQSPPAQADIIKFPKEASQASPGGVTSAFTQLLGLFQHEKIPVLKWFGLKTYDDISKRRKSGAVKVKKGAMVDHKAA